MPKPLLVLVKIKLSRFGLYQIETVLLLGIHNTFYRLPLVLTAKLLPAAVVTIPSSSGRCPLGSCFKLLQGIQNLLAIFSPDKKTLVSSGWDDVIKIWELPSGKLLRTLKAFRWDLFYGYSPDGQTLATGSKDKTIKLWNLRTGELITLSGIQPKFSASLLALMVKPSQWRPR